MLPPEASTPCVLDRLPVSPNRADLEIAYIERGTRLVECEIARALAVETLTAERLMQDRWRQETEAHPRPRVRLW